MTFELFCMTLLAFLLGMAVCFNGYRWFVILLPFWGFFVGFGLGAQTITALFGDSFLSTTSGWIVGFIVGLIFALLSYFLYYVGFAIFAGSAGYALAVGLLGAIGVDFGVLAWIVGVVAGIVVAVVAFVFNLQKWVVMIGTAFLGAGALIGTLMFALGVVKVADLGQNVVQQTISDSFWWLLLYIILGIAGLASQIGTSSRSQLDLSGGASW